MGRGNRGRQVVVAICETDHRSVGIGAGAQATTVIISSSIDGGTQVLDRMQLAAGGVSSLDDRAVGVGQLREATTRVVSPSDRVGLAGDG